MNADDRAATYRQVNMMRQAIADMRVRDKRAVYLLMRTAAERLDPDTFFPLQGFTAGMFAVGQVLSDTNRKPTVATAAAATVAAVQQPPPAAALPPPPPPPAVPTKLQRWVTPRKKKTDK